MTWTKERREKASREAKERIAKKKEEEKVAKLIDQEATIEEATEIIEKGIAENGGEMPTADQMDKAIFNDGEVVIDDDVPINVVYVNNFSRGFKLSLADPRRGRKLVDGSTVKDYTIKFRDHRYTTKSLKERIGIEGSPQFLNKEVEIFTSGVQPINPTQKRKRSRYIPQPEYVEQRLDILPTDMSPEKAAGTITNWDDTMKPPMASDLQGG